VSLKRDRNTRLNCATARSVARTVLQEEAPNADISDSSAVASDDERAWTASMISALSMVGGR